MQVDPLSLGFLILVILLGGVIAYIADRVGRTLGKKRLKLMKLRPRHTAELFTVLAGLAIPLITVLIVMAISRDVREWILEGRNKAQRLEKEVGRLEGRQKVLEDRLESTQARITDLTKREQAALQDVTKARGEVGKLTIQREKIKADYDRAAGSLSKVQADLAAKRNELTQKQAELGRKLAELDKLQGSYNTQAKLKKEIDDQNLKLIHEIQKLEDDELQLTNRVKGLNEDLERNQQQLADKQKEIKDAEEKYQQVVQGYQAEITRLSNERAQVEQQLVRSTDLANSLIGASRLQPMTFQISDELGRIPLGSKLTEAQAREALRSLLASARAFAAQRGAKPRKGEDAEAGFTKIETGQRTISVDDQENEAIRSMVGRNQDSVAVARSLFNVFGDEFVPVLIEVYDNPLVYREGEIIAEIRIDGTQASDNILAQIQAFLAEKVSMKAQADRMVPFIWRGVQFGEVAPDQLLATVSQIHDINRPVRLVAFALQDTHAADRLRLGFRLR